MLISLSEEDWRDLRQPQWLSLLQNPVAADLLLVVHGQEARGGAPHVFQAHQHFLALLSPLVRREVRGREACGHCVDKMLTLVLTETSERAVRNLLQLVYCGQVGVDSDGRAELESLMHALHVDPTVVEAIVDNQQTHQAHNLVQGEAPNTDNLIILDSEDEDEDDDDSDDDVDETDHGHLQEARSHEGLEDQEEGHQACEDEESDEESDDDDEKETSKPASTHPRNLACTRCSLRCRSRSYLAFHLLGHLREQLLKEVTQLTGTSIEQLDKCPKCDKIFSHNGTVQSNRLRHLVIAHNFGREIMSIKERAIFDSLNGCREVKKSLKLRNSETGEKVFKCRRCSKVLVSSQGIAYHIVRHMQETLLEKIEKKSGLSLEQEENCFICHHSWGSTTVNNRLVHYVKKHRLGFENMNASERAHFSAPLDSGQSTSRAQALGQASDKTYGTVAKISRKNNVSTSSTKSRYCHRCKETVTSNMVTHLVKHLRSAVKTLVENEGRCTLTELRKCFHCNEDFAQRGPLLHNKLRHFMLRHGYGRHLMSESEAELFKTKEGFAQDNSKFMRGARKRRRSKSLEDEWDSFDIDVSKRECRERHFKVQLNRISESSLKRRGIVPYYGINVISAKKHGNNADESLVNDDEGGTINADLIATDGHEMADSTVNGSNAVRTNVVVTNYEDDHDSRLQGNNNNNSSATVLVVGECLKNKS